MRHRSLLLLLAACGPAAADEKSPSAFRFKVDNRVAAAIDTREIRPGNPRARQPKDLIPAIFRPEHVPAREAGWLRADRRVLGVAINGEARAYPLFVLEGHEVVNDVVGGRPVAPNY